MSASPVAAPRPGGFRRFVAGFRPPQLPTASRRAFRFQMAFTLLYAFFEAIMANAPLMAVKAMNASDVQLQMPLAMTSIGLFGAVLFGNAMATRRKKPFVLTPGFGAATAALLMAWAPNAGWFLAMAGVISICDFAMRPAIPSIMRSIYPDACRSHVAGTLRQYASILFLVVTLASAAWLSAATPATIQVVIRSEITIAGLACVAAFASFRQLPDLGDGSAAEAAPAAESHVPLGWATLAPFRDRRFRKYLAAFFVFGFGNLFHQGVVPAYFARDIGLGYVQATMLMHVIPNLTAFLSGGYLTSWFERTSVWRSYALVALCWGLDPLILALAAFSWPALILARSFRGPAILGSMVIAFFTGVHSFAPPGEQTSRYMAAQFLMNGVSRLVAPMFAAFMLSYLSRRSMIFCGSLAILAGSAMFWWQDRGPRRTAEPAPDDGLVSENA